MENITTNKVPTGFSGWDVPNADEKAQCQLALARVKAVTMDESDTICNLSNTAALLWQYLKNISWCGFYLMRNGELVLAPFQGKYACRRIKVGNGVCGTAVSEDKTQIVPNVHEFPGHIACDSASNSEIVVPIHYNGEVVGVLDIDSAEFDRFHELEQKYLEEICKHLEKQCDWKY